MGLFKIFEDRNKQTTMPVTWDKLMTEEQKLRGQYYSTQYFIRAGEIGKYVPEWDELQKLYQCERDPDPKDPNMPNSFIPLMTPTVEGQVASMIESNIEIAHVTNNPAHEEYMGSLDKASEYVRKRNQFFRHMKDFARGYDLLGNAWVTLAWESDYAKRKGQPNGYPRIIVPPVKTVMVDGKIKDYKDLQHAEYIIHEIGFVPLIWARSEYGDDYAEAISLGYNRKDGLNADTSWDEQSSFTLIHVWTRNNEYGNLQLIEMDINGLILRESDPKKPYYKYVNNEYPFAFARMIPRQGNFYGYGDGKILKPMQRVVNSLTDELELAARFSAQQKIYVDPDAKMDLNQINSDPSKPVMAKNPNQNIRMTQGQGINPTVVTMIEFLLRQAQAATRYNDIMSGSAPMASATATSVNTQMMQGSVGIRDKKSDLAEIMQFIDKYSLNLCLEYWDAPFWVTLADGSTEFIDMTSMRNVPASVPLTTATAEEIFNIGGEIPELPKFEIVRDGNGIKTTDFDFSTKVFIGQGIAKGKIDMYNMVLGLMQVTVAGDDGTVKPLVSAKRAKQLMEDIIGFKLSTKEEEESMTGNVMANSINQIGMGMNVNQPPVQAPPENLASTVPGTGSIDKRGIA